MSNRHLVNAQMDVNRAVCLINAINDNKTLDQLKITQDEAKIAVQLSAISAINSLNQYLQGKK